MAEDKYLTISELASLEGITPQAVHKRLNRLNRTLNQFKPSLNQGLNPLTEKRNGVTVVNYAKYAHYLQGFFDETPPADTEPPAEEFKPVSTDFKPILNQGLNQFKPVSTDEEERETAPAATLDALRAIYEDQIRELKAVYEARIQDKEAQILEARKDADTWREAFRNAQALHAGTIKAQLPAEQIPHQEGETARGSIRSWLHNVARRTKRQ